MYTGCYKKKLQKYIGPLYRNNFYVFLNCRFKNIQLFSNYTLNVHEYVCKNT